MPPLNSFITSLAPEDNAGAWVALATGGMAAGKTPLGLAKPPGGAWVAIAWFETLFCALAMLPKAPRQTAVTVMAARAVPDIEFFIF
jgi:hypothetical protein